MYSITFMVHGRELYDATIKLLYDITVPADD
jgi:hypothetical protein